LDLRLCRDELLVFAGDGEAFELAVFRDQSAAGVLEAEGNFPSFAVIDS
jgi:hypothetical protein